MGECGEEEKEEGWRFGIDWLRDRRVVDEGGRCALVVGVKTAVVDEKTCLLSTRPARQVEDGGRGRRGGGVFSGQGERTTEVTHCP